MPAQQPYSATEPKRAEIDTLPGPTVLEFGNDWCGHCRRAQPLIAEAFAAHPGVRHLKIADASLKCLGRSFGVKFLADSGVPQGRSLASCVQEAPARSNAHKGRSTNRIAR